MKTLRAWTLVGALLSIGGAGCGPKPTGAFDAQGYKNTQYGFRVAGTEALLGDEWKLDNLYRNGKNLQPKKTDGYVTKYEFDTDGDDVADQTVETLLYDLRYKHFRRDALVWLRSFPLSTDLRDKDLRVLLQRYVDEVSGAGYEAVSFGRGTTIIREKRFAANLLSRGSFTVAKQDAYSATFDVANVDEVAVSPNARRTRVRIVLLRTPYTYKLYRNDRTIKAEYPVFMLAGYANLPEDFDKDEPAFRGLLDRIDIDGQAGTTALVLEGAPAAPAAGDVAAPAPSAPSRAEGAETPAVSGAAPAAQPAAEVAPAPAPAPSTAPASPAPSATPAAPPTSKNAPPSPAPSATPAAPPASKK